MSSILDRPNNSKSVIASMLIVASLLLITVPVGHAGTQSSSSSTPAGFPGGAQIISQGNSLVAMVEDSAQFQSLANGIQYHVNPYSSFGYSSGPSAVSTEVVVLFSPNNDSYIEAEVNLQTNQITNMYFTNSTQTDYRFTSSPYWSGYDGQYCSGNFLGICTGHSPLFESYGNVQVANSYSEHSAIGSLETSACCALGQWVGMANASGGTSYLVQGGTAFICCHLTIPSQSNSDNLSLWTEFVQCSTCSSSATFLAPPTP